MESLLNWLVFTRLLSTNLSKKFSHTRKVAPIPASNCTAGGSIELEWVEYAQELNEQAAARLEIDECERYLSRIDEALCGSRELRKVNKDMGVWPSPCGRKLAIVKAWEDIIEMEYAASTIKYIYFILCLHGNDMNAAIEFLMLHPIDESVMELSPEISLDGAS